LKNTAIVNKVERAESELQQLVDKVVDWHHARNLINGATDQSQYVKLIEEAGELAGNITRGKPIDDDIGDMLVVLINIAERNHLSLADCLNKAWDDIKDRKGRMINGSFIKETDL
jgi:NTP pyrophosphatase (non-canonical NTP hydrolase)